MYSTQKHYQKNIHEVKKHIDSVWKYLEQNKPEAISQLEKIFIGSGNSLGVNTKTLSEAIQYSAITFKDHVGKIPRRISLYGNTSDILKQGEYDLKFLECGGTCSGSCSSDIFGTRVGLNLIYWGIESGSDDVLHYINKGSTKEDILNATEAIRESRSIRTSVMIMPGLGGIKYFENHLRDTLNVLNNLQPEFVTFIGIDAASNTSYARNMAREIKEGTNRPLTNVELAEQLIKFIDNLEFRSTIGCFDTSIQPLGFNPVFFGSVKLSDYYDRQNVVEKLKRQKEQLKSASCSEIKRV
jgi:hypothetical protein